MEQTLEITLKKSIFGSITIESEGIRLSTSNLAQPSCTHETLEEMPASCSPDTCAREVAAMMRDRNIGDVRVIEEGKLRGIVTDRDLTTRALTDDDDPRRTPIRNYLTAHVVTGHPVSDLDQVAEVMAEHQVRRLPIVQDGQVLGIVSLGDLAIHARKKQRTAEALAEISVPVKIHPTKRLGTGGRIMGILAADTALAVWMSLTKSGHRLRKQVEKTGLPDTASALKDSVHDKLASPESRQQASELVEQLPQKLGEL